MSFPARSFGSLSIPSLARRVLPLVALSWSLSALAHGESWPFTPPDDQFSPDAQLDLRSMNEKVAGEAGFVTRSKDGNDFVLGNGKPARFWAMNVGSGAEKPEDLAHEARFLAKHGVNLIRLHMEMAPGDGSKVTDVNMGQVEAVWRTVAAMKKEGIYSIISPYWASVGLKPSWGITGHTEGWGVLFCDAILQGGYKAWMKTLYTTPNPHTGVPLCKEPAVAVIQLQNEDSLLFWTMIGFINQKGMPYDELRKGFGTWASKKYGSIDKALEAWGKQGAGGDEPANGMLGFYQVWEITSNPGGPKGERVADQIAYWTQTMYDFNKGMESYLKQELGCKQLVNATNWRPADVVKQMDAERYSYTANDVAAVNKYFGGVHVGPDAGWAVDQGDGFTNESCTLDPLSLPTNIKQTVGQPFMVTESCWVLPNLYASEGPLMIAAYSSLNGMDAYFWFSSSSRGWDPAWYGFRPIGQKWAIGHPMGVGQFPAAALIYRNSYAKQGTVVVHEERELHDIWHEATPIIAEEKSFDPNRDSDKIPTKSSVKTGVDPLAFLVGRVEVVLGGTADPAKNKVADFSHYIDKANKTISSTTGESKLDYNTGLYTLDTPKAQGAAGFLAKAGDVALADVTFSCKNPYATITVVTLDGADLKDSGKILVQIGTTTRATNWQDHEGEFEVDANTHQKVHGHIVDNAGVDPWTVENAVGTISIKNAKIVKATMLDPNGMAMGDATGSTNGSVYTLTLPPNALYVVLSTAPAKAK